MTAASHNEALAEKFGVRPPYPAVTKQLEAIPFNRKALHPYGYNPSISRFRDRIIMAYRYHGNGWASRLAMVELDASFKITAHKDMMIPGNDSQEDPHLFVHQDALWLSWVESQGPTHNWTCCLKYGQLEENAQTWSIKEVFQPKFGQNDGTGREKNWVFFSTKEMLGMIYQQSPKHISCLVDRNDVTLYGDTESPLHFPWGGQKGGTIRLLSGDSQIRFWHSTLDNESNPGAAHNPTRRYYIGCNGQGAICSKPVLCGSEIDDLTATERSGCRHYKSNVVFCSGTIAMPDGSFILSVGINDSQCALIRAQEKDLNL